MAGLTINLLRIPSSHKCLRSRYRPASYGNQIIFSPRPRCWIQILTVMREQHCGRPSDVYNSDRRSKLTAFETIGRWLLLRKRKKSPFEPPFRALMGNVRTPSMARWKARGQLYIRRNWTFFRYLLWLRRYEQKSVEVGVFRREGGSLWAQISKGRGLHPPTTVGIRVAEWLSFLVV